MKVKPGYKQTEVGVIPEDWEVKPLGVMTTIATGNTPSTRDPTNYGHEFMFVSPADLGLTKYVQRTEKNLSKKGFSTSRPFPKGSVLVVCIGSTIGKMGIAPSILTSNQQINAVFPALDISSEFIYYAISANASRIKSCAGEQAVPIVNKTQFAGTKIVLPSRRPEQEAVAEALSNADALIESLEKLLAKKRNLKHAAMQELLTGKKRLPGFEANWTTRSLGSLFSFSGGFSASRDQLSMDGYCYLHYGDIHKSVKTYIDVATEYQDIPKLNIPLGSASVHSLLRHGDVVFVDASEDDEGTSKHVVVTNTTDIPYISGLHTIVAKSKTEELDHAYKRFCFQTKTVRDQFLFYSVGTKVTGISKSNIQKVAIPLPPFPEQAAIAAILCDMVAEILALEVKLSKARQIKQGMMQELLTGRIRLI